MGHHRRIVAVVTVSMCALAPTASAFAVDIDRRDVTGTPSDDVLRGTSQSDRLWAGDGYDQLFGMGGEDRMWGGSARDQIFAGKGDDFLSGSSGRDLLAPGGGRDHVRSGPGRDVVLLNRDFKADVVSCGGGLDVVRMRSRAETGDHWRSCEHVRVIGTAGLGE